MYSTALSGLEKNTMASCKVSGPFGMVFVVIMPEF